MESRHGKGVADAIGAVIKDKTNIKLFTYTKEDIDSLRKAMPVLTTAKGTANLHEATAKSDGKFFGKELI